MFDRLKPFLADSKTSFPNEKNRSTAALQRGCLLFSEIT